MLPTWQPGRQPRGYPLRCLFRFQPPAVPRQPRPLLLLRGEQRSRSCRRRNPGLPSRGRPQCRLSHHRPRRQWQPVRCRRQPPSRSRPRQRHPRLFSRPRPFSRRHPFGKPYPFRCPFLLNPPWMFAPRYPLNRLFPFSKPRPASSPRTRRQPEWSPRNRFRPNSPRRPWRGISVHRSRRLHSPAVAGATCACVRSVTDCPWQRLVPTASGA